MRGKEGVSERRAARRTAKAQRRRKGTQAARLPTAVGPPQADTQSGKTAPLISSGLCLNWTPPPRRRRRRHSSSSSLCSSHDDPTSRPAARRRPDAAAHTRLMSRPKSLVRTLREGGPRTRRRSTLVSTAAACSMGTRGRRTPGRRPTAERSKPTRLLPPSLPRLLQTTAAQAARATTTAHWRPRPHPVPSPRL